MELEIYEALRSAGVADDKAKAAVESINREIDRRYALHSDQLATRGDVESVRRDIEIVRRDLQIAIAEGKTEIIKWCVGSMFASAGIFAAIVKLMGQST